jgi:hypothetical protein
MNTSSGLLMPCVTLSTTIRLENMCVLGRVSLAEGEGETIVPSEAPPRRPPALPDSLTRLGYKIRRFGPLPEGFAPLSATDEQLESPPRTARNRRRFSESR